MKLAILGWGSLIMDPGNLHIRGRWQADGPFLPIEFARISNDGRLTLVLYPGTKPVQTLWALSAYEDLNQAKENLRERERTSMEKIGYISIPENDSNCRAVPQVFDYIRQWAVVKGLDAVIWTDLQADFKDKIKMELNAENITTYLSSLTGESREKAIKYIRMAPSQVETKLRRKIELAVGD